MAQSGRRRSIYLLVAYNPRILRAQNQLHFDDTSLIFIRNATTLIERKYSCSNIILEIQSSSCHIAGQLLCSHLIKMLFALYNTEPVRQNMNKIKLNSISIHSTITTIRQRIIQMPQLFFLKRELTGSMGLLRHFPSDLVSTVIDELINYQLIRQGPYINTTSRGIVHMKSFPSDNILNDPIKRNMINQLLTEIKMDLANYMVILCNSSIKDKQILTTNGIEMLLLPEHKLLHENLKKNYPDRNFDITATSNNINNSNNRSNDLLNNNMIFNQSPNHETQQKTSVVTNENVSNHNAFRLPNFSNQLYTQLHANTNINQFSNISLCENIDNSNAITNTLNINNNTCSTTELNNIVCLNSNKISSTCTQTTVASTGNEMAFKESDGTKNGVQILDNNVELNSNTINSEQACNSTLNIAKKIAPSLNYTSPPSSSINFMDKRTSNSQVEHTYSQFNQIEYNTTTNQIYSLHNDQVNTYVIDKQHFNTCNVKNLENYNWEPTTSNIEHNEILVPHNSQKYKRRKSSTKTVKAKRNNTKQ
ncbi:unnamed protein product [Rotaria sordida]|uniref:Uncharacterized protein n=1 Tax=Rotaria sordida TaxID=392033 RepID=A0A819XDX8_9BILA|nr:unnamed protein product [Rotaria sordida]